MAGHGGERRDAGRRPIFKNEWEELICFLLVEEQYADLQSARNQERQQRSLEKDPFETERTQNVARLRAELHKMPRSKRKRSRCRKAGRSREKNNRGGRLARHPARPTGLSCHWP